MDISNVSRTLGKVGGLPQKITDVTEKISKSAASVAKITDKMQKTADKLEPRKPVTQAAVGLASKTIGGVNSLAQKVGGIKELGKNVAEKIQPAAEWANKLNASLNSLKTCQATLDASALLVNAIVDTASGHFHPRANEAVFTQFNEQWDTWAKTVDGIFHGLSPDQKVNVLEALARDKFGDNIFALGSAVKKESAGIFGGIADFEDSLKIFRGSYRNPAQAVAKIEQGVKGIVRATERVSNSLNSMITTYQTAKGLEAAGNPVLAYLGNIHNTKAISALNKVLSGATGAFTIASDGKQLADAVKSKNPVEIYNAGKQTYKHVKTIVNAVKKGGDAAIKNMPAENALPQTSPKPTGVQKPEAAPPENGNDDRQGGNSDSYVCSTAKIKCSFGDKTSTLTVLPDRTIWLTGEPQANISDHMSMVNIAPFGKCRTTAYPPTGSATAAAHGKLTPMPCVPGTNFPWMNGKDDVLLKGQPALLKSSKCKCIWGGTITITNDGQKSGNLSGVPYAAKQNFSIGSAPEGDLANKGIIVKGQGGLIVKNQQSASAQKGLPSKTIISELTASSLFPEFKGLSDNNKKGVLRGANALPDNISTENRLKLANHTRAIAHKLGVKIDAPMTIEQADKQSANPNYAPGNDYGINCATVAATYALRLQGLNVTAKAKNETNTLNDWLSKGNSFKVWKNIDGTEAKPSTYVDWMNSHTINNKPITEMTPALYKRFIEDNTKEEGVYIITVGWQKGGGHATIIQQSRDKNGELQLSYIEPQVYNEKVGVKQDIDNLVKNMDKKPLAGRGIMRVDNKMFDPQYASLFEKPNENTGNNQESSQKLN